MKQHIDNLIQEVSTTLNIDAEIVSLLLRKYGWKTDRLMENYLLDSIKCLNDNHLNQINQKDDSKYSTNKDLMVECPICVNDVKISTTFSLDCQHRFCTECWTDYISSEINNKSFNSIFITCPGHKCQTPLKNSIIKRFASDTKQWLKFENYIVQSFITNNEKTYRFCPSPGCNFIIYCNDQTPKSLISDDQKSNNPNINKTGSRSSSPIKQKKTFKSKYKQQQQKAKEEKASIEASNTDKSSNKNTNQTKAYQPLDEGLDEFQFFGQKSNATKNKPKTLTKVSNFKDKLLKEQQKEQREKEQREEQQKKDKKKNSKKTKKLSGWKTTNGHSLINRRSTTDNFYGSSCIYVQCKCGYDLCFSCLEEYHAPATCKQVEEWNFKCLKESDNAQWIVTNTKKCPKCFTRIERNHGCNHMVCTKCQYEFCWVCMGSWKEHGIGTGGYYRCNKYRAKSELGNKQKLSEKEDEELDKFVHYYNRFHNHAQSRQFLIESSHKVLRKIKNHINTNNNNQKDAKSWIDVEFLQNAHDEIFFCRQILKYTYVYAYYLKTGTENDNSYLNLFEFLQQDLEKNCEILHELCEQNWKDINATHIINYTNITHRFVKQLLHGIAKGLTR